MKSNENKNEEFLRIKRERRKLAREKLLRQIHAAEKKFGDLRKVPEGADEIQKIQAQFKNLIPSPFNGEELYKKQNLDWISIRLIDDIIIKKSRQGYENRRIAKMLNISVDWVKDTVKNANEDHQGYFRWMARGENGESIYSTSLGSLKEYFEYYHHGDLMRDNDKKYKWLPKGWNLERGKYYYWQLPIGAEYIKNGKPKKKGEENEKIGN